VLRRRNAGGGRFFGARSLDRTEPSWYGGGKKFLTLLRKGETLPWGKGGGIHKTNQSGWGAALRQVTITTEIRKQEFERIRSLGEESSAHEGHHEGPGGCISKGGTWCRTGSDTPSERSEEWLTCNRFGKTNKGRVMLTERLTSRKPTMQRRGINDLRREIIFSEKIYSLISGYRQDSWGREKTTID